MTIKRILAIGLFILVFILSMCIRNASVEAILKVTGAM